MLKSPKCSEEELYLRPSFDVGLQVEQQKKSRPDGKDS